MGYHCHIGSQVFTEDVFERAAAIMIRFIAAMRDRHGFTATLLNLGGGYGVPYVETDGRINIPKKIETLAAVIAAECAAAELERLAPKEHYLPVGQKA